MRCVVYIRQAAHRANSKDPEPVYWDQKREERLWKILQTENEVNWTAVADKFNVSVTYILQQAAWLYEKELCLLKARMNLIAVPKTDQPPTQQKAERRLLSMARLEQSDSDSVESEEGFVL